LPNCPACHNEIAPGVTSCPHCGAGLDWGAPPVAPPPMPAGETPFSIEPYAPPRQPIRARRLALGGLGAGTLVLLVCACLSLAAGVLIWRSSQGDKPGREARVTPVNPLEEEEPRPTATKTATNTPRPTDTPPPTDTPIPPTDTPVPTDTPLPTPAPADTPAPQPTATPPPPTDTPPPAPTDIPTATPTLEPLVKYVLAGSSREFNCEFTYIHGTVKNANDVGMPDVEVRALGIHETTGQEFTVRTDAEGRYEAFRVPLADLPAAQWAVMLMEDGREVSERFHWASTPVCQSEDTGHSQVLRLDWKLVQ
jgi:hypothetical protein